MNFVIWLLVGGIVGWLASTVTHTNGRQGIFLNILVGIVGAYAAGVVLTPLLGITTINENNFSLPGLIVSLLGAIILSVVINLFRVGGLRHH